MSTCSRILVGLTLEFDRDIDFEKVDEFTNKYPELDEYDYHFDDKEGRLLLISDGMDGEFLRLIKVDKLIEDGSLGDCNEFFELPVPAAGFNKELIDKMSDLYEEYTGERPKPSDFKYAMWSQWQ